MSDLSEIKRFAPAEIFHYSNPHDGKDSQHKTAINVTVRDWGQSNTGWLHPDHAKEMLKEAAAFAAATDYAGTIEIAGGTFPRNHLDKAGENPYEYVRKMREAVGPKVKLMALVRSNAGPSMADLPADVVKDYVKRYVEAGIDVIRNFHAHNDTRQFKHVFDATHEAGAHFQAAFSYSTFDNDPTVYNPKAVVDFFKDLERQGVQADSYALKDPAGVLTPMMAKLITKEMKKAMHEGYIKPRAFGIHTHDQCGYAAASCLAAAEAGADFVDASPGPGGRAAQTPVAPMLRKLEDAYIDAGYGNDAEKRKQAIEALARLDSKAARIAPIYQGAKSRKANSTQEATEIFVAQYLNTTYGTNIDVEQHGMAGGQTRDALDRLADPKVKGLHLMPSIKQTIPEVRANSGGSVLVTPTANNMFTEAYRIRKALEQRKDPNTTLSDEIIRELTGDQGPTPVEVDPKWQHLALRMRSEKLLISSGMDYNDVGVLRQNGALDKLVDQMQTLYAPTHDADRLKVVTDRKKQLEAIVVDARTDKDYRNYLGELNNKIARSGMTAMDGKTAITDVQGVITKLGVEAATLSRRPRSEELQQEYADMQKGKVSAALLANIKSGNKELAEAGMSDDLLVKLMGAAGVTTIVGSDRMAPGLPNAKKKLEAGAAPLRVSPKLHEEDVSIMAMFGSSATGQSVAETYFQHRGDTVSHWKHPENDEGLTRPGPYMMAQFKASRTPDPEEFKQKILDALRRDKSWQTRISSSAAPGEEVTVNLTTESEGSQVRHKIQLGGSPGSDFSHAWGVINDVVAREGGKVVSRRQIGRERSDAADITAEARRSWFRKGTGSQVQP